MFRKVETETIVITEVEDSDDAIYANPSTAATTITAPSTTSRSVEGEEAEAGQSSKGKTEDKQTLINCTKGE